MAIVQGKDFVVIAADTLRTIVVNGITQGTAHGCKIARSGQVYFVWAGDVKQPPFYDVESTARMVAAANPDPGKAGSEFERRILPGVEAWMREVSAHPKSDDAKHLATKHLLFSVVFVSMKAAAPTFSLWSFNLLHEGRKVSITPEEHICTGPCGGRTITVVRLGDNADDHKEDNAIRDRDTAISAAFRMVQHDAKSFPATVGEPIIEVALGPFGDQWLPLSNPCREEEKYAGKPEKKSDKSEGRKEGHRDKSQ